MKNYKKLYFLILIVIFFLTLSCTRNDNDKPTETGNGTINKDITDEGNPDKTTDEGNPDKTTDEGNPDKTTDEGNPDKTTDEDNPDKTTDEGNPDKTTDEGNPDKTTDEGNPDKTTDEGNPEDIITENITSNNVKIAKNLLVEANLPKTYNITENLSKRMIQVSKIKNRVLINDKITRKIDSKKTETYLKDRSLLNKYFPRDEVVSYDFVAVDETIPENVRRQFFKEAYEYILSTIPKEEVERVNNSGMAYVSDIGFDYVESSLNSSKPIKYALYKNVKFYRLMVRDPYPYDPLLKAKLTGAFEVLLTGRGKREGHLERFGDDLFIKNKELVLEYLYYSFKNSSSIASSSLLDPTMIVRQNVLIPGITFEDIIDYMLGKDNRINGTLLYNIGRLNIPLPESLVKKMRKLYKSSLEIIKQDISINASIEAIIQAMIAFFYIQKSTKEEMQAPEEITFFLSRNSDLIDFYSDVVKSCLYVITNVKIKTSYALEEIIEAYMNCNIKYKSSSERLYGVNSINNSLYKWQTGEDGIYYTTSAMELNLYRPTEGENFLIKDLYKRIYDKNYPYLVDFLFQGVLTQTYRGRYIYKLTDGKGNYKWYMLEDIEASVEKIDLSSKLIDKNSKTETIGLGYYNDMNGDKILFFKRNPETLYNAFIGVSLNKGEDRTFLEEYNIKEPPIMRRNNTLIVQGHFDNKLDVNKKTGEVSFGSKPKSTFTKDYKVGIVDLKSGNLTVIEDSLGWENLVYMPIMDYLYYKKGTEYFLYDLISKTRNSDQSPYNYGPKKILEIDSSSSKVMFIKEVGRTGRDGLYIYNDTNGKSYFIDYADQILYTGGSTRGTYITYKTYNPFYEEENTFLIRLYYAEKYNQ